MNDDDFKVTKGFESYVAKPEVTDLAPTFLVAPSRNVLIDYAKRVISRNGYKLFCQANTGDTGIKGSYEWDTSTGQQYSLRSYNKYLEFALSGIYYQLVSNLPTSVLEFAKIYDTIEKIDMLLWVLGDNNTYKWSGGVTKVWKSTASTLTKQGVLKAQFTSTSVGTATINIGSNIWTVTSHGLVTGNIIQFSTTGALPTGFIAGQNYYVRVLNVNTFVVSLLSGGIPSVASGTQSGVHTANLITPAGTISFTAGVTNVTAATINDSNENFLNAGFAAGDTLNVSGSISNSRNFTIASVTAGTITLIMSDMLTTEAAGPSVTLHNGQPTWAAARFMLAANPRQVHYNGVDYTYSGGELTDTLTGVQAIGTNLGNPSISIGTPGIVTLAGHGLVAGDTVQFTTTGALPGGIAPLTLYFVIPIDANTFEISTDGTTPINTSGPQSGVHTLLKTNIPAVSVGGLVWQTVMTLPNPSAIDPGFKQDLIGVQLNQLILASTHSQDIYGSSITDYTNFTLTSSRAPGDPWKVTMDNFCTSITPISNSQQTTNSLVFTGGTEDLFTLDFKLSQDNTSELVRMIKVTTSPGAGIISKNAIGSVKNGAVYISHEPTLDFLTKALSNAATDTKPLSDLIKNDFDSYDFTDAHIKYYKRAIYIAVPHEGIVLIYDLMRNLWQPPQTIPISRLAIINDLLYGHSSITNETYQLFVGTNDNGVHISQRARFAYNNGGRRDRIKNMDEYWSDGYITANGELDMTVLLGFEGSVATKVTNIDGSDSSIVVSQTASSLGQEPLGTNPLGGASSGPLFGLPGANAELLRFYQVDTMDENDFNEFAVEYSMDSLDGQFAIVAHGANMWDAGTSPNSHKK